MRYNAEQVINGIIRYADNEIMIKLPTMGKWVVGTALNLATDKVNHIIVAIQGNAIAKMLDVVDENGMIDIDLLVEAMKKSADMYGNISLEVPLIGSMSFSASDIDSLKAYIEV